MALSALQKLLLGALVYLLVQAATVWYTAREQYGVEVTLADGERILVPAHTDDIPPYALRPKRLNPGASHAHVPERLAPLWPSDSRLTVTMLVSTSPRPPNVATTPPELVLLRDHPFALGDWRDHATLETHIPVPLEAQHNGTLWAHFYVALAGHVSNPYEAQYQLDKAFWFAYPLTQHLVKRREAHTRNLLADSSTEAIDSSDAAEPEITVLPHYHPNISLHFVPNAGVLDYRQSHPAVRQFINLEQTKARDGTGKNSWYYPILYVNTFYQLRSAMTVVNDTVTTLPVYLDVGNLASWKFKAMAVLDMAGKESARAAALGQPVLGGSDGSEMEMIKEALLTSHPALLAVTGIVSVAHMVLETLAFGSDIAHYRSKKDNVGISVRSILANIVMQIIILLYLIDNAQTTSWIILGTQAVGILIELWKITTIADIRIVHASTGPLPYRLALVDKPGLSETEERTKEYDEIAFRYMYLVGIPLLLAYAVYSLVYDVHKSWYSYTITTLVGSVYAYGFLLMVPSLYINYRLKSVAHMPGKAMMYKFLNTFIDDLFAFTIKMPFLHRLATFRDDIIFFVYLYQRYQYRTDYTRVNEFGQGGDADAKASGKAEEKKTKDGNHSEKDKNHSEKDKNSLSDKELGDNVGKSTGRETSQAQKRRPQG